MRQLVVGRPPTIRRRPPEDAYLRHRSRGYAGAYNWADILAAGDEPTMVVLIPLGATGCTWRGTELVFTYPEPEPEPA